MAFWKRQKKDKVFKVDINSAYPLAIQHGTVNHEMLIKYAPRPKPTMLVVQYQNSEGQVFQQMPIALLGQSYMPVSVPMHHVTGNREDISKPDFVFRFILEYERANY